MVAVRHSRLLFTFVFILVVGIVLAHAHQSYQPDGNENATAPSHQNNGFELCPFRMDSENRTFALSWGVVALQNVSEVRNVPLVNFSVDIYGKTNVTVENVTASVPVVLLEACNYERGALWKMEFPGYLWAYDKGKYYRYNGTAVPKVLIANTSEYLYALVYQTSPQNVRDVRRYVSDDYFYILGENGTVKKFDLGSGVVPVRNAFLVSNGSYVLMGFERPQLDGSPYFGYVMILDGKEVIFQRLFRMKDPTCLCYIIPGGGRIDKNGCATFGLYDGSATYCNGTLTFTPNSDSS
ncbi:hypothetical protein [Palaeococcus ferrophilus]|uniref:hypothetical protein n=1 Tax=Palaeococcus ferrophilus TaxID=83868 RepID=UPI001FE22DDD|nr:hypothetical protein [Palaeococcus ferrophilus]